MSARLRRRFADLLCRAVLVVLPPSLQSWGHAIRTETSAIPEDRQALCFALESLMGILPRAVAWHVLRHFIGLASEGTPFTGRPLQSTFLEAMANHPRNAGIACMIGAVVLGIVGMAVGAAPIAYLVINASALVIGLVLMATLSRVGLVPGHLIGAAMAMMAVGLLATSVLGEAIDGVARWVRLAGIALQPSLILVPVMLVAFARRRTAVATVSLNAAAVAMAIQTDLAMLAMIVLGLAAVSCHRPDRHVLAALAVSIPCCGAILANGQMLATTAHVDQVLITAFQNHGFAGVIVLAGLALLLVPAVVGWRADLANRESYAVFAVVWLTATLASCLGSYPTPLVGYGGSAIVGYALSLLALPVLRKARADAAPPMAEDGTAVPFDHHLLAGSVR